MTNKEILELIIKGNEKDALRAIEEVRKKAAKADDKMKKSSTATTKAISGFWGYVGAKLGNTLINMGSAVVKFASDSYKAFQQFEYSMAKVEAVTGGGEGQIASLTSKVKELGSTTQFTADQIANAAYNLGMAGMDTTQIEQALPALSSFAIATGTDIDKGADLAVTSMTALGMSMDETTRFTDVLAKTSTSSATTVAQLGEALRKTAPTAGAMGISVEELGTYFGLMADGGIRGSSAGTAFTNMLTRMDGQIPKAKEALDKLGVSAYDNEGNFRGLETVLGEMREGWGKLTQEEQTFVAKNLATQRGMAGFTTIMETSNERLEEMKTGIENAGGATEEMAEKMADTSKGINDRFISAIDGAKIALGETLAPVIDGIKSKFTNWLDVLVNGEDQLGEFVNANMTYAEEEYKVWSTARDNVMKLRETYYGDLASGVKSEEGLQLLLTAEEEMLKASLEIHKEHLKETVSEYAKVYPKLAAFVPDMKVPEVFADESVAEYEKSKKALEDNNAELAKTTEELDKATPLSKEWFALKDKIAELSETKVELGLEPIQEEAKLLGENLELAVGKIAKGEAVKAITSKLQHMGDVHKEEVNGIIKEYKAMEKFINKSSMDEKKKTELLTGVRSMYTEEVLKTSKAHLESAKIVHDTLGAAGKDYNAFGEKMGALDGNWEKLKDFFELKNWDGAAFNSTVEEMSEGIKTAFELPDSASGYIPFMDTVTRALQGSEVSMEELTEAGIIGKAALLEYAKSMGISTEEVTNFDTKTQDTTVNVNELTGELDENLAPALDNTKTSGEKAKEGLDSAKDGADNAKAHTSDYANMLRDNLMKSVIDSNQELYDLNKSLSGLPKEVRTKIMVDAIATVRIEEIKKTVLNFTQGYVPPKLRSTFDKAFNKHADGGIFNGKTQLGNHLFGEAGKEAIVPLTNSRTMQPFAKAIADNMVNDGGSGDTIINIKEMNVRNDNDIKKIAKELESLRQRKTTQRR